MPAPFQAKGKFSEPPRSRGTQRTETNLHIKICPVGHARPTRNLVRVSVTDFVSDKEKDEGDVGSGNRKGH